MKIGEISKLLNELNILKEFKTNRYLKETSGMLEEEIDARIKEIEETETHKQCVASMMNTPLC